MTFMVNTKAEHSIVATPIAPFTKKESTVIGATGIQTAHAVCQS